MKPDETDRRLLDLLRADGRASYAALGQRLHLSPAAVRRRMGRLEREGVIRGYTALIDERSSEAGLQAFVELACRGVASPEDIEHLAANLEEVQSIYTTAGDPDALAYVRVADIDHLRRVIAGLRTSGLVTRTKTLMVVGDWQRARDEV